MKIIFFYRKGNKAAQYWAGKIKDNIKNKYPSIGFIGKDPDVVIVLGGDGSILEAARKYHHESNPMILGLNLGNVGFLASVREPKNFINSVNKFLEGKFSISERMVLNINILRGGRQIFKGEVLNEIVAQSILGMVDLEVFAGNICVRKIRGGGVLVATATGSTAFNLSAHGPIVMPNIKCLIITEIMDHNVPTPSIVIKYNEEVTIKINGFRQRGILSLSKTGQKIDVILAADGESIFPLEIGDEIVIQNSPHLIKFAELEKHYFFKSLEEKFGFK